MTGFRSEVEGETVGAFQGIGKKVAATVGLTLGAAAGYSLVKSSVQAATSIQKQLEVVRFEFGRASQGLIKFADTAGIALGDSNRATDEASARFGLLFKSLGIGPEKAAAMTLGFEKLALSVNAIRGGGGQGAATLLQQIVLAAAGNTRGLKQMGIVVDSTSEKWAALKLGIIQSTSQALTPAQKTQAIYAIATQHLGQTMALAKAHAGDLANVQAHLSAEWVVAKEALGKDLLPVITRAAAGLTDWLSRMNKSGRLQADFNGIVHATVTAVKLLVGAIRVGVSIWERFSHAVGGTSNAFKILLGVLVLSKVNAISNSFRGMAATLSGPVRAGINQTKTAWGGVANAARTASKKTAADYSGAAARIKQANAEIANSAVGSAKKATAGATAQIKRLNGQAVNAASVAAKKSSAEYSGAASRIKRLNAQIANDGTRSWKQLGSAVQKDTGAMSNAFTRFAKTGSAEVRSSTGAMSAAMSGFATTTKAETRGIGTSFRSMATTAKVSSVVAFDTIKLSSIAMFTTIKAGIVSVFAVAWPLLIGLAVGYIITHWATVKRYTLALVHATVEAFRGMADIVIGAYRYIYGKALYFILSLAKKIIDGLAKAAGWIPFIGGKIQAAAKAVDGFTASVHRFAEGGRRQIIGGFHDITQKVTQAWSDSLAKSGKDPKTANSAKKAGQTAGQNFTQGMQQQIQQAAPGVTQTLNDTLQNAIRAARQKIQQTIMDAKNNLDKIGSNLAKTIDTIQQKIGGAVGGVAGSPQGKAFEKLKKLIESGAPSFEIAKAQAELSGQLQNVGQTQQGGQSKPQKQLADLTAAFNQGKISNKQFVERLHKILKEDGISIGAAMKAGGKAFADTYKAQVAALKAQAKAIAAVPAKLRGIGGAGGAADIKIIRPLDTIRQEAQKVAVAAAKQRAEEIKQQATIAKATAKSAALQQQAASAGVKLKPSQLGQSPLNITHFLGGGGPAVRGAHGPVPVAVTGSVSVKGPTRGAHVTPAHLGSATSRIVAGLREVYTDVVRADRDIVAAVEHMRAALGRLHHPTNPPRVVLPPFRFPVAPHVATHRVTPAELGRSTAEIVRGLKRICDDIARADERLVAAIEHKRAPRTVAAPAVAPARSAPQTRHVLPGQLVTATGAIVRGLRAVSSDVLRADRNIVTVIERLRAALVRLPRNANPAPIRAAVPRVTAPRAVASRRVTPAALATATTTINRGLRSVSLDVLRADRDIVAAIHRIRLPQAAVRVESRGAAEAAHAGAVVGEGLRSLRVETRVGSREIVAAIGRERAQRVTPSHLASAAVTILHGLRMVSADVLTADKDIVTANLQTRTPVENLRRTSLRIADEAGRQRARMIRNGTTTNALLRRMERTSGRAPGFNKERKGTGGQHARTANAVGVKP